MMKVRTVYSVTPSLAGSLCLLLFLLASTGCGLGTEVGNGVKPGGEEEASEKASSSQVPGEQQGRETVDERSSDPVAVGDIKTDNQSSVLSPQGAGEFDFDVNILLSDCASPFESAYDGVISLGALTKDKKMSKILGTYDNEASQWLLKDAFGKVLARVTDSGTVTDHKVLVTDNRDNLIASGYTCGEVSGSASGDYFTYTAVLSKGTKSARLAWRVLTGDDKDKLESITITPDLSSTAQIVFTNINN